jgi:hypothetical protein
MRFSKQVLIGGIGAVALIAAGGAALAGHGKVGLWDETITMSGMAQMLDMSKLPPEIQARMRAAGVSANGNSVHVQHCMTAQEVAMDTLPRNISNSGCKISNSKTNGHTMSTDMVCTGNFNGTGHMEVIFDSPTHYSGQLTMNGTSEGRPMKQSQTFESKWVSADCGSVNH